jgi:hypothetical protein
MPKNVDGCECFDLTNPNLAVDRVRKGRNSMSGECSTSRFCPRCLLACHALVFKPSVEVMPEGLRELGISDFDFLDFFEGHWGRVIKSAFGFQHLNPNLSAFAIYRQPAVNLKVIPRNLNSSNR